VWRILGLLLGAGLVASLAYGMTCPSPIYLGNAPERLERGWVNALQGIAHFVDETGIGYWFFTQTNILHKISFQDPLRGKHPGTSVRMPAELAHQGYYHFGDLDQYAGYLFVPVTAHGDPAPLPVIAVFTAADLRYVGAMPFPASPDGLQQHGAGWLALQALNPSDVLLYSSNNHLTPDDPNTPVREDALFRYNVDMALLRNTEDLAASITFKDQFPLREANGDALQQSYHNMQGGVFSPWGDLFLVNGLANHSAKDDHGGIHIFTPSGELLLDSTNGSGEFNYQYHGGFPHFQEPEGIDWWDLDTINRAWGSGQLHVLMVSHANPFGHLNIILGDDDCGSPCHNYDRLFLKHYALNAPEPCYQVTPTVDVFPEPTLDGYRLDWCLDFGSNCGEPAATAFCQAQGYTDAVAWSVAQDIGAQDPTKVLGTGQVCAESFCDGFEQIQCSR